MQKNVKKVIYKKGVTLTVLIITIIVALILLSAIIININFNFKESKLSKFVYDISNLEDALESYYILNEDLPKNSEALDKESLKLYQNDSELYLEISKNNDEYSQFYIIDLNKINVENIENIEEDKNQYAFSYPNFNVYYLKGKTINKIKYFSITDKIDNKILKKDNKELDTSVLSVSGGTSFKVSHNGGNFKNTLDITTEYDSKKYTLGISVIDSNNNTKTFSKTNGEKSFKTATDIDSTLSSTSIEKIIFELKNSSNEVVAKEDVITSNYDPFKPSISNITINNTYTDMNTLNFDVSDTGKSGVSKVMYEYIESTSQNQTIEYMKTKAKVIDVSNISNGKVSIKVPKEVKVVQMIVTDKAGNMSENYYASGF